MTFDINAIEDPALKEGVQSYLNEQLKAHESTLTQSIEGKYKADIEALQGNSKKLLEEKASEAEKRKNLEAIFGERKPEEVAEMLKRFESDEDAALLQEGKLDEFKKRIAERERTAGQALVEQEAEKRTAAEQQAAMFKQQIHDLTVGSAIKSAFVASGGVKEEKAQEYAAIEASRWWSINEDGEKECRDPKTGDLVKGKTGLITESEWVQEYFRPTASFLFEGVQGSGASGGTAKASKPFNQLSIEEQSALVDEVGLEAAMAL